MAKLIMPLLTPNGYAASAQFFPHPAFPKFSRTNRLSPRNVIVFKGLYIVC